MKDVPETPHGH